MPYALLSVSDKTGIETFAAQLVDRGFEILSTGGTGTVLRDAGIAVKSVSDYTGFPEIMGGRVKTLHPAIHAGLLARLTIEDDVADLDRHGFSPIRLVAVNLYPFRETVARPDTMFADALEQIDIGGPTMLRAAAKNHGFVWPVCQPSQYSRVIEAIDAGGEHEDLRRRLAAAVFEHTATYDAAVAGYMTSGPAVRDDLPPELLLSMIRIQPLRYGENPDQEATFYRSGAHAPFGIPALEQLHGKELSYNNLLDVDGALQAIGPFLGETDAACAILKHTTPCGIAVGRSVAEAYRKALACDPVSAFGSTVVLSQPVTEELAEALAGMFVECLVAPGYASAALELLTAKPNVRILVPREGERLAGSAGHIVRGLDVRGVAGGLLVQTPPQPAAASETRAGAKSMGSREPTDAEWMDLAFAWAAVQSVKSNAILLARDAASLGIGAGQMSRVDAVQLAISKAAAQGLSLEGCVLASDAFFPFRDGVDVAAAAGVTAIIQPGGSKRDEEVVQAA
ncbi:MAG: bifunctional phosphoribosylaminoimidazolecarboxamide formyltransferase/IMP cyclohydrolase, partial [Gemmatimonadota bacterium]|nr:bifunctional phosphoribosylaminoimidazolecarboxamide formyltransferase/IMP cyclohydrolase [Gemmatimonadota bacterium]